MASPSPHEVSSVADRRVAATGQRELLFIAIIVVLGISAAAVLLNSRVKLQEISNLMQFYRTTNEAAVRNINQLVDSARDDRMSAPMASFIVSRISDNMSRSSALAGEISKQLDALDNPITRTLASVSPVDIAVLRNNQDTQKLRDFAGQLTSASQEDLKSIITGMDKGFSVAIRYGDYLDELRYRVARSSELSHQGTQPLLVLLLGIGASVLLGIWAVWLRALKPGISALQASHSAVEGASKSLQEQNLAYVRREIESLAAQRIAKFGYWVMKDGGDLQCSAGLAHLFDEGGQAVPRSLERLARIGTPAAHPGGDLQTDILSGYKELSLQDGAREFSRVLRCSNGAELIVRERVESSIDAATASRYMIGIMLDVTELAQAQARAARADKLESIGILTGVIAHDFNNALALIKGSIDLMELRPETVKTRITHMRQAVANATTLIGRLSSIGTGEAEDQDLLDLGQILPETVNLFKANVLNTVQVTLDLGERQDTKLIRLDRGKFESAILNLLVNAGEATAGRPDAAIKLSCGIEVDPMVEGRDGRRLYGQFIRLELSDNGAGMSAEVLRRAVDPFFSTKLHHSALQRGLGLWSVYQTVHRARGGLSIVSTEGQGTVIVMHFPRVDAGDRAGLRDAERQRAPLRRANVQKARSHILIVDDAAQLLSVLHEQLSAIGYTTRTASDIPSALQVLQSDDIDVVVSDIKLRHGETGLQLATHIRNAHPDKKMIFISGHPVSSQGNELHADISVVSKPIDIAVLDSEIQRVLSR